MKTRLKPTWIPGSTLALALVMASISCGFAQDQVKPVAKPAVTSEDATRVAVPAPADPAPIALPNLSSGPPEVPVPQPPFAPPPTRFSAWTKEIIKMAQARIDDGVMLTYIDSAGTFNLGADEIVYLRDLGISSQMIVTMLQHDADIVSGARPLTMTPPPSLDPTVQIAFASSSDMPGTTSQSTATVPAPLNSQPVLPSAFDVTAPVVDRLAIQSSPNSVGQSAIVQAVAATAAGPSFFTQPAQPQAQRLVYPVREPHPVELTPPITVYAEPPERPLNTIVITFVP